MSPKFGNSSIIKREVIITLILLGFDQKSLLFDGFPWIKFINLRLALDMALKFYTGVAKKLKLNVQKFCGIIPGFVEFTWEKLVGSLPPY